MARRIYRSYESKMLGGVCGGLGEYFDIDPTVIRIIAIISLFVSGGMTFIAYIVAWMIIPMKDESKLTEKPKAQPVDFSEPHKPSPWTTYLPGLIFIIFGSLLLIRQHWFWFPWRDMWPMVLVAIGLVLIFAGRRTHKTETETAESHDQSKAQNHGATS